jgi:curved DNA-binding protein CbpA
MENRFANAAWEREREHESLESKYPEHADDFVDNGSAKRFYEKNKESILRSLSGKAQHEEGQYDWYKEWEEWARRQQQQQQQAYGGYGQQYGYRQQQQQQQYQRQQQQAKKPPPKYQWDFNPDDPYSVLGIKRGATKKEVSEAFRKNMLKYHPDVMANASDAAKERATERSKLITEAYRKIKAEMK